MLSTNYFAVQNALTINSATMLALVSLGKTDGDNATGKLIFFLKGLPPILIKNTES